MRGSVDLANLGLLEFRLVRGMGAGHTLAMLHKSSPYLECCREWHLICPTKAQKKKARQHNVGGLSIDCFEDFIFATLNECDLELVGSVHVVCSTTGVIVTIIVSELLSTITAAGRNYKGRSLVQQILHAARYGEW